MGESTYAWKDIGDICCRLSLRISDSDGTMAASFCQLGYKETINLRDF